MVNTYSPLVGAELFVFWGRNRNGTLHTCPEVALKRLDGQVESFHIIAKALDQNLCESRSSFPFFTLISVSSFLEEGLFERKKYIHSKVSNEIFQFGN